MVFLDGVQSPERKEDAHLLARGGSTNGSVSDGAVSSLLSGIREMLDGMGSQNPGMISIPVYLGNNLLDEVIVDAQKRMSLRSGGR